MGNDLSRSSPIESIPEEQRKAVLGGKPSLEAIAEKILNGDVHRIVLMTGAGISVAAGIPDFRSPDTGLYTQLGDLGLPAPEAIFHIQYFEANPFPFYRLAKQLMPGSFDPTDYTQNIDNLELLAGLPSDKLVTAHGSFADVHCIRCKAQYPVSWFKDQIMEHGFVQRCSASRRMDRHRISDANVFGLAPGSEKGRKASDVDSTSFQIGGSSETKVTPATISGERASARQSENETGSVSEDDAESNEQSSNSSVVGPQPLLEAEQRSETVHRNEDSPRTSDVLGLGQSPPSSGNSPGALRSDKGPSDKVPNRKGSLDLTDVAEAMACAGDQARAIEHIIQKDPSISHIARKMQKTEGYERCDGLIKPDITFFGEALPKRFRTLCNLDLGTADLLIVLGTSLQVYPFASLISLTGPLCPRLLINREDAGLSLNNGHDGNFIYNDETKNYRDVFLKGDCDDGVRQLCRLLGWEAELDALKREYLEKPRSDLWKRVADSQFLTDGSGLSETPDI